MKHLRISLAAVCALILMAGCGGLGNVLGTGSPSTYPSGSSTQIQGVVTNIDTNAHRIDISSNNNYTNTVYYDSRTQFSYQNQNVNPSSIRRGDQVNITAYNRWVLLTGEVADQPTRNAIEAIALAVPNVRGVTNELQIAGVSSLGSRTNDSFITSKVKARFVDARRFSPVQARLAEGATT